MRVVQALIVHADRQRVLMTHRHNHVKKPSMWEYPGGKVEKDESLIAAITRELREELAIEAIIGQHLCRFSFNAKDDIDISMFAVTQWTNEPQILAAQDLQWVLPDHAVDYLPCLPGVYLSYRTVMAYLSDLRYNEEF